MQETASRPSLSTDFHPGDITRPDKSLMKYYALTSILAGPAFFIPLLVFFCKYITLRYHFDDKGVMMSWGVLFRRETLLTYKRIQDIHLTRNIVQRWMGLATVSIQTASGSSSAEMAIEGVLQAEALRDFLYQQMRGARGLNNDGAAESHEAAGGDAGAAGATASGAAGDEALVLLREIRDALVAQAARKGAPS